MLLKMYLSVIMLRAIPKVISQKMSDAVKQDLLTPLKQLGEACGYESCPITREGMLNVHIVPHSHGELGYTQTFHEHYTGVSDDFPEKSIVNWKRILDAVITELWNNEYRKFTLSDTPYLFHWWSNRDGTVHRMVYQLIRQGRLHIVGGGWGMADETCTSYHALIDQFTYTLRKLNQTFGPCGRPLVAWQADNYGHSREFANLASMLGFDGLFINPISYEDEVLRMTKRELEMLWRGSDDLGSNSDMFTHKLFDGHWSPPGFCFGIECNDTLVLTSDSLFNNVEERVNTFIDSVRNRQGYSYSTKHIMVIMGKRMAYYDAPMWFNNIDSLILNAMEREGGNINIMYSAPACYLKAVHDSSPTLPIKQDDFLPITFDKTTHLTGLFTSRPTIKFMAREGHLFLQMAKQMFVLAQLPAQHKKLYDELTWIVGVFQDHNIISGNMRPHVKNYYTAKMYHGVQKSTLLLKRAFNKLRNNPGKMTYYRCGFNISSCKNTNALRSFVVIYNPLAWPVTMPVRIPVVKHKRHVVFTPNLVPVKAVSMKMSAAVLNIPNRETGADHEIVFIAEQLPPMGYRSYYIESTVLAEKRKKRSILKKISTSNKKKYLSRQTDQMKIDDDSMLDDEKLEDTEETTTSLVKYMNDTYNDMKRTFYVLPDRLERYKEVISDVEESKYKMLFDKVQPCTPSEVEQKSLITDKPKRIIEENGRKTSIWKKTWGLSQQNSKTGNNLNKNNHKTHDKKKTVQPEIPNEKENFIVTSFAYVSPPPRTTISLPPRTSITPRTTISVDDYVIVTKEIYNSKSLSTQKEELRSQTDGSEMPITHKDFNSSITRKVNSNAMDIQKEDLTTRNTTFTTINSEGDTTKTLKRFTDHDTSPKDKIQTRKIEVSIDPKVFLDEIKSDLTEKRRIEVEDYQLTDAEKIEAAAQTRKMEYITSEIPDFMDTYHQTTEPDSDSEAGALYRPQDLNKIQPQPVREESFRRMFEIHPVRTTTTVTRKSKITTTTEYDPFDDPDFDENKHYFYTVSKKKFIKNKYVKVYLDDKKQVVRVSLSNGVEVALTINLYYYASDDPDKMGRHEDKKPNPNVFKVMDAEPVLIQDYVRSVVHKTYLVEEVQYSLASWAGFVLRVYVERPMIELDWVVGPVPIADDIGKDVFIRYRTDLASGGVFYTDSNGRQTVKRVRNTRPTFKPVLNNIPSNIYPVTSKIYIEDTKKNIRLSVFNDRAQGGTSLHDGEIDLMLHRRILTDESDRSKLFVSIPAPLNDTEYGQGIVVRGKHIIYISKADYKPNKIFEKKLAKEIEFAPTVFASPYNAYGHNSKEIWYKQNNEFKGVVKRLPAGVHVLTLQEWDDGKLLLRLENYLEKADAVKTGVKTVFVKNIFANITITSVKETMLGGNIWAKDWIQWRWNTKSKFVKNLNEFYNGDDQVEYSNDDYQLYREVDIAKGIVLVPQQIRTFICSYEFHS